MTTDNYFSKYGFVYGISEKFAFGKWEGYVRKFTDLAEAKRWLLTEEYDFRTRELCSLSKAKRSGYFKQSIED